MSTAVKSGETEVVAVVAVEAAREAEEEREEEETIKSAIGSKGESLGT